MNVPSAFNILDINAIRLLCPPFEKETWDKYIDRMLNLGLMHLGEALYLAETYGKYALEKEVQPVVDLNFSHTIL